MKYCSLAILLMAQFVSSQQIDTAKLGEVIAICQEGHSDGLIIFKDDKIITENYFGKEPVMIDIKSVTKSVTNLAFGYLVTTGKLNIDQKVHEYYPEWNQEVKRDISIRHLLTHTSGLLDSDFSLVEQTSDIISFALASDVSHPVGQFYIYNNKAVNLLAGIVEKADGRKLDVLMEEEIFNPLGIEDFIWPKDSKGNPYTMAFLQMYPRDVIKLGRLVMNKGLWKGKQIIHAGWFDLSMAPGADFMPEYGLLWELLTENFRFVVDEEQLNKLRSKGVQQEIIDKTERMQGIYGGYREYFQKLKEVFGKDRQQVFQQKLVPLGLSIGRKEADGITGYAGIGYLGQYLIIYPDHQLIAFRGINHHAGYNWDTDEITEFPDLIRNLVSDRK